MTAPPSAFSPQGSTHVAAVIGCPVRHSLSPVLHNAAYRALGLDWLRCKSNPFNKNKNACGLWSDLEGLLAAATLVVGAMSLVELAREEQKVVGEAAKLVRGFWEL